MRHRRGHNWDQTRKNPKQIQNFHPRNNPRTNFPPGRIFYNEDLRNYTYVGRYRCGYGPNAIYKAPNGEISNITQIIQTPPKNQSSQRKLSNSSPLRRTSSLKIEPFRYCTKCGARARDEAYFCTECGHELGDLPILKRNEQIKELKNQIKDSKNQLKILKRKRS